MRKASAPVICAAVAMCLALLSGCPRDGTEQLTVQEQPSQTYTRVSRPDVQPAQQTDGAAREWYIGSWQCTKVRYEDKELDASQVSGTPFAFELRQDGTVIIIGTEQANPAAWETTDNGVVIIDGDWEMLMEKQGDTLVWNDDGIDMIITRIG